MTAPVVLLPPLKRHLGSSDGGGHLIFLEGSCFCACLTLFSSTLFRLHWSSAGGCFDAIVILVVDRFERMLPPWLVG